MMKGGILEWWFQIRHSEVTAICYIPQTGKIHNNKMFLFLFCVISGYLDPLHVHAEQPISPLQRCIENCPHSPWRTHLTHHRFVDVLGLFDGHWYTVVTMHLPHCCHAPRIWFGAQ